MSEPSDVVRDVEAAPTSASSSQGSSMDPAADTSDRNGRYSWYWRLQAALLSQTSSPDDSPPFTNPAERASVLGKRRRRRRRNESYYSRFTRKLRRLEEEHEQRWAATVAEISAYVRNSSSLIAFMNESRAHREQTLASTSEIHCVESED